MPTPRTDTIESPRHCADLPIRLLHPGDRYLSCTVAQDGLQANARGPQDAFARAPLGAFDAALLEAQ